MKKIHGIEKICDKLNLLEFPPIECKFSLMDKVIYTNDYGVKFEMIVVGFSQPVFFGLSNDPRFIHLAKNENINGSAYWFPHAEKDIKKVIPC